MTKYTPENLIEELRELKMEGASLAYEDIVKDPKNKIYFFAVREKYVGIKKSDWEEFLRIIEDIKHRNEELYYLSFNEKRNFLTFYLYDLFRGKDKNLDHFIFDELFEAVRTKKRLKTLIIKVDDLLKTKHHKEKEKIIEIIENDYRISEFIINTLCKIRKGKIKK